MTAVFNSFKVEHSRSIGVGHGHRGECAIHTSVDTVERPCRRSAGSDHTASESPGHHHAACNTNPSAKPSPGTTPCPATRRPA